jgi:alpha-L-fucosidase
MPNSFEINNLKLNKNAKISLIGASDNLKWSEKNGKIVIDIPLSINKQKLVDYAWVFKISQ